MHMVRIGVQRLRLFGRLPPRPGSVFDVYDFLAVYPQGQDRCSTSTTFWPFIPKARFGVLPTHRLSVYNSYETRVLPCPPPYPLLFSAGLAHSTALVYPNWKGLAGRVPGALHKMCPPPVQAHPKHPKYDTVRRLCTLRRCQTSKRHSALGLEP